MSNSLVGRTFRDRRSDAVGLCVECVDGRLLLQDDRGRWCCPVDEADEVGSERDRYKMRMGMGNWWVEDGGEGRLVAMCTRREDAELIAAALNRG